MAGLLSTLEPPAGAYGNPRTAARHSSRFLTKRRRNPLARWPLIHKRRKRFGPEPAKRGRATACRSATASTSRRTAATVGPTWGCRIRSALRKLLSIRRTATRFTYACRENYGATAKTAAFTKRPTAAKAGAKFSRERISRPAAR